MILALWSLCLYVEDILPGQKDTSEKTPSHKQIWSTFYLDENTVAFVKRGKQVEKRYCIDHAIVGHDEKEIPLQQLFEFKNQGRPNEQLHKDICERLSALPKENLELVKLVNNFSTRSKS